MLKMRISILLIGLTLYLSTIASVSAQCKKLEDSTTRARETLRKLGTGKEARVTLELSDNTKLEGSISKIANNYFVITDDVTQVAKKISYTQIARLKGYNGLTYVLVCGTAHC